MIIDTTSSAGTVDPGNLAVRLSTNGWTLTGIQLVIPLRVAVLKRSRVAVLLGPTSHVSPLDLNDDHIELIFHVDRELTVPRSSVRGVHVDVVGQGSSLHIVGANLPCSLPAFELHFKDRNEATTEPAYGSVELKSKT